jgi:hypothetical protein
MAKNTHKVPKKMWSRWSKLQQAMFNRMWMEICPELLPTGVKLTPKQFSVLRHNICFAATRLAQWN